MKINIYNLTVPTKIFCYAQKSWFISLPLYHFVCTSSILLPSESYVCLFFSSSSFRISVNLSLSNILLYILPSLTYFTAYTSCSLLIYTCILHYLLLVNRWRYCRLDEQTRCLAFIAEPKVKECQRDSDQVRYALCFSVIITAFPSFSLA